MDFLFVIVMGALWGSFANVCIYRLPLNKGIVAGRSFCTQCKKKISWYDNIPLISFVIIKGRCRKCKKQISPNYLIVEILSSFSFFIIYFLYGATATTLFLIILCLSFIIIFFIDLKHFIIPNSITYPLMILGFLKSFDPNLNSLFPNYVNSLIGGLFGYGIIWLIIYFYKVLRNKEGMGLGDAKLFSVIGFWFGWVAIPFVIFSSSIIALSSVIPSLLKKNKTLSSEIPFGPFIILGCLAFIIFKKQYQILLFG
ncbi:prepilin peptidase [Candidatus Pelagibacter sp.]|nr:prepilin peptidase [Candidatus Pelagibacter sp.]